MPLFFYPMLFWYIVCAEVAGKRRKRDRSEDRE
ncbi:hypothetical protein [Ralstonia phage p2110]|uniref:Uncharacterized protein n=2 Tax=Gervaisevirus claudettte TaxID=2846041 RepID=A0A7G5B882_9CAUD|nr:hypothetical protein KMC50_gp27 [Ralstonia phage Claudette]QMV32505.1 hypothetical protein 20A_00056 [Ralstonia phage Alix]QMV32734.1 hypothetical protein 20Ca_00027 [Ralstonia phage Claudette]WAX26290.1 hypothetical protein [Ralstonia phage p2110]